MLKLVVQKVLVIAEGQLTDCQQPKTTISFVIAINNVTLLNSMPPSLDKKMQNPPTLGSDVPLAMFTFFFACR